MGPFFRFLLDPVSTASRQLLDAYSTARLRQLNGVENENNRILDLCFFSEEISMDGVVMQAPSPLVKICRHHPPVLARMEISPQIRFCDTVENVSYDYSKADFNKINDFLAHVDWDDVFRDLDANLAASTLSGILWYAIDQHVPTKSERAAPKPAWSNADLRCLKRLKKAALRRHSKHRTDATRAVYLEVNTEYKKLNDRLYNAYQERLQNSLKSKPKRFWRHVNDQRKESGLPSTMTDGSIMADSTTDIANLFRTQFSNVFTNEHLSPQDVADATANVPRISASLQQFSISDDMIIAAGKQLKSSTGCGPDGVPSLVLKSCLDSLAAPLATVFNMSLTSKVFPEC